MNRQQYEEYKNRVDIFFNNGLINLSTVSQEPFFSWHSCDCCGSSLGGNRYKCNGYNEKTKEVETYEYVCEDCVYYCEYGQLDDAQMEKINNEILLKGK
jgi:hypothetical protein